MEPKNIPQPSIDAVSSVVERPIVTGPFLPCYVPQVFNQHPQNPKEKEKKD